MNQKEYNHSLNGIAARKKYSETEKGRIAQRKADKNWYIKNQEKKIRYSRKYYKEHKDDLNRLNSNRKAVQKYTLSKNGRIVKEKYRVSERGREAKRRVDAKRKRNLQWIKMFDNPFDKTVKIDYHHITDTYVVAIPRDLHHLYMGKMHREKTMSIAKQIYLE